MLNIILLIVFIASLVKCGIEVQKFNTPRNTEFLVCCLGIAFPFVYILINAIINQ
jgi:hypothetical protein